MRLAVPRMRKTALSLGGLLPTSGYLSCGSLKVTKLPPVHTTSQESNAVPEVCPRTDTMEADVTTKLPPTWNCTHVISEPPPLSPVFVTVIVIVVAVPA